MPRKSTFHPGAGLRLTDVITLGVLTRSVPSDRIRQVLEETDRASQRERDLPAHVMVYYVMALALYRAESTREVLRLLLEGLKDVTGLVVPLKTAGRSGISQARSRLGEEPLKRLYHQLVSPIATPQTQGAHYRKWRLVAMDGTTMEVPDTKANAEAFGRPHSEQGESAYPLLRIVGLVEVGTHVLFGAELGNYATGEVTLARKIVPKLRRGMLCLADRYFPGFELWSQAAATGADLVWRVRRRINLPRLKELDDGSYLSRMEAPRIKGSPRRPSVEVRVIEYVVDGAQTQEIYRLITTILDPAEAPAQELAQIYRERWEFETTLDEFKTHLRGARTVLRSMTPELIRQEVWGLLLTHYTLRGLMHEAALHAKWDPDRVSFIHAVRVVRRTLPRFAAFPPTGMETTARTGNYGDPRGAGGAPPGTPSEARGETQAE